jgi:hypothetical protein
MSDFDEPLSQTGQHRREEILRLTLRAARRRRQRPQIIACAIATIAVLSLIVTINRRPAPFSVQSHNSIPTLSNPPNYSEIVIEHFGTDPTISTRLALTPIARHWQQIGDDELLNSLANAGQPAGIVQMDGQAILLTSTLAEPETR